MVDQAKIIKEKGLVEFPIIWSWNQKEGVVCDFTVLLFGNGGAFLDASGKPAFNNEKGVQVLTWMKQTLDDGLSNPSSVSSDENAVRDNFVAGNAAFAVNWLFQYTDSNDATKSKIVGQGCLRTHAGLRGRRSRRYQGFQRGRLELLRHHGHYSLPGPDLEVPDLPGQQ